MSTENTTQEEVLEENEQEELVEAPEQDEQTEQAEVKEGELPPALQKAIDKKKGNGDDDEDDDGDHQSTSLKITLLFFQDLEDGGGYFKVRNFK